jgi:hypothetical protein
MTGSRSGTGRSLRSRFDPYLLAPALLGLLLFQPLLARGIPQAPDALLHFYRAALWRWAWDGGALWPRWQTLAFQGYGYPVLSYQAPLLYFLTAALSYVTPGLLVAYKGVMLLACLLYGVGMYLWTRDLLGPRGAVLASAAYVFATFRFRELYFVGGYSQFLAFGLYPLVLYFFQRLAARPSRVHFLGAVLSLAAVLMSHNISAMLFAPVLGVYGLGMAIAYRRSGAWRRLALAGALGLAVSAVFWLPAVGEMRFTRTQVLTQGYWDVREHFLRADQFLAESPLLDDRAANPSMPFNFGRLHLVLAGLGALTLLRRSRRPLWRFHIVFALAVVLIAAFMMLPASTEIWRVVPLIKYVEYPWRLYGVAFLGSSLLVGASLAWLERTPRLQLAAGTAAMVGLILATAVYQFPRTFVQAGATPRDYLVYENAFRAVGTTAGNEFLPPSVRDLPAEPAVGPNLVRTALAESTEGQGAVVLEERSDSLRLRVSSTQASELTVTQFYFPGWRGWLDGQPVALRPSESTGLITLDVPAGEHELTLRFEDTPLRRLAAVVSLIGLVLTAFAAWRIRPRAGAPADGKEAEVRAEEPLRAGQRAEVSPRIGGSVMAGAVLVLLVLKVAWVGPHTSGFRLTSPPGEALPATHRIDGDLGGKVALLGYDLEPLTTPQGGEVIARLYWQALQPLDVGYASFVELVAGPEQQAFARSDSDVPGQIPPVNWTAERYVVDAHRVPIPSDAPPVAYTVWAGLYNPVTMERLGAVELPDKVHIVSRQPLREAQVKSEPSARFGDGIRLLGHRVEKRDGALDLTLYWQAGAQPDRDYQVFVHLLDNAGRMAEQNDGPPVNGYYPTSAWLPDQIIADTHRIPLSAESRAASVAVGLYDLASAQRLPAVDAGGARLKDDSLVIPLPGE